MIFIEKIENKNSDEIFYTSKYPKVKIIQPAAGPPFYTV